jgi:hypothetical protein
LLGLRRQAERAAVARRQNERVGAVDPRVPARRRHDGADAGAGLHAPQDTLGERAEAGAVAVGQRVRADRVRVDPVGGGLLPEPGVDLQRVDDDRGPHRQRAAVGGRVENGRAVGQRQRDAAAGDRRGAAHFGADVAPVRVGRGVLQQAAVDVAVVGERLALLLLDRAGRRACGEPRRRGHARARRAAAASGSAPSARAG